MGRGSRAGEQSREQKRPVMTGLRHAAEATGFEPAISALTGPRVRPLHHASSCHAESMPCRTARCQAGRPALTAPPHERARAVLSRTTQPPRSVFAERCQRSALAAAAARRCPGRVHERRIRGDIAGHTTPHLPGRTRQNPPTAYARALLVRRSPTTRHTRGQREPHASRFRR